MRISDLSSDVCSSDLKAPVVAVNVWYHVGSKDEPAGLHGFAHLFEHLMFNGSEHYNDEFFRPLEPAGATKMNGTTWYDRTNYFENVPTSALDRTLWLESDRMGHGSEEHTSELQSLMRISYAVFCLKKKKKSEIT